MPKININEYDLTKAGTSEYENFSVVVPGFVGKDCDETVFDENGIYECSSQTDFVQNVGKRSAEVVTGKTITDATTPTIVFKIEYNPNLVAAVADILNKDKVLIGRQYQTKEAYTTALNELLNKTYKFMEDADPAQPTVGSNYEIYYAIPNTSGKKGLLRDDSNRYVLFNAAIESNLAYAEYPEVDGTVMGIDPIIAASYNAYYVIETGKEGEDGSYIEDRITHYGNQMAYELLGLGYTVLFKKLNEYNDKALEDFLETKNKTKVPKEDLCDVDGDTYVLKPKHSAVINELGKLEFWECLRDKSTYDFRYLVTGLLTNNDMANTCILSVADHSSEILLDDASISDGRGDCIALIDLDKAAYTGENGTQSKAIVPLAKEAAKWASAYAAVFAPYVSYILAEDPEYDNNSIFPASFHYLACAANSDNNNFAEWYANAGYTRGVSKYTIQSTGCKFGEIAVQSLEPRFILKLDKELKTDEDGEIVKPEEYIDVNTTVAVNLIINIKGSYYLWGNRTCKKLGTRYAADGDLVAQHFLNIRQLCTTIKKQVYTACRRLTFDPNSDALWGNFRSLLTPMLEQMKADQGIRDYKFVKDATDRKALLKARIRIVPIEAVEDFDIGLYLEDSLEDAVITES